MFSSKQIFAINGRTKEDLEKVIQLAMELDNESECDSFFIDEKGYLVFCSFYDDDNDRETRYPFVATIKVLVEQIYTYLGDFKSNPESLIKLAGEEPDNDGSVYLGWEIFAPMWYGKYKIEPYGINAFLAVKPCWIVYGK